MVTAYKGLLKEKEALEATVSALSKIDKDLKSPDQHLTQPSTSSMQCDEPPEMKNQIITLMNSLATLSAEKSRMEASFQADKRQLRSDCLAKDQAFKEQQERLKSVSMQHSLEMEAQKTKLNSERMDREKETNDHMVMVRELQKLLSDERQLKDNLEMQLNNLKMEFSQLNNSDAKIRELNSDLEQSRRKIKDLKINKMNVQSSTVSADNSAVLKHLQTEIASMKQQHAIAIKSEQKRAARAEDLNKRLAVMHEDRVAILESRLAELSATVGTYDRLRQQDQDNIFKLKDKIAQLESTNDLPAYQTNITESKHLNINSLVEEISQLKKLLLIENAKLNSPQDLSKIFSAGNDHSLCTEEFDKLNKEFEKYRQDNDSHNETIDLQKTHIKTLQDKIQVLNRNIDDQEEEMKRKFIEYTIELKNERSKFKESMVAMENDMRGKNADLEQQLQKQRERSLTLLEEKENEIRSLKTSFEIFLPKVSADRDLSYSHFSDDEKVKSNKKPSLPNLGAVLGPNTIAVTQSSSGYSKTNEYHMLHYVHELARKDVEISALRKAKHSAETLLRQALQDKVTTQEALHDRIDILEENVDR